MHADNGLDARLNQIHVSSYESLCLVSRLLYDPRDADNASAKIVDGLFEEIARERNFKRLHPPGKHADRSTV